VGPRALLVVPFDASTTAVIESAIRSSELGFNPLVDSKGINVPAPRLTTELRAQLVRRVRTAEEAAKNRVRSTRQDTVKRIKAMQPTEGERDTARRAVRWLGLCAVRRSGIAHMRTHSLTLIRTPPVHNRVDDEKRSTKELQKHVDACIARIGDATTAKVKELEATA